MSTLYDEAPVVEALIAFLEANIGNYLVGDHVAPAGTANSGKPFLVVSYLGTPERTGPAFSSTPDVDAWMTFQIDAVGLKRDSAMMLADKVRGLMLGRGADGSFTAAFPTAGLLRCHDRISEGSAGPLVEGVAPNEVYTFPERYSLAITPA